MLQIIEKETDLSEKELNLINWCYINYVCRNNYIGDNRM